MRRVGVVGDGLTGLIAGLSVASNGAEVVVFGHSEPLGGLASPVHPDSTWLFDRLPLFWKRKSDLDKLLSKLKVPMPTRKVPLSKMAFVRGDQRFSLPTISGFFRRTGGHLSAEWPPLIQAARSGDLSQLEGPSKDAATLLSLLWNFDLTPDPEAVLNLGWKNPATIAIDGWVGASGRLIAACLQTDVTFEMNGPVTGFRRGNNGDVDGVRRKGRVLPVDAVVQASSRSEIKLYGRYLGLTGQYLRPHVVLWDADREVILVDLANVAPERVPEKYRGSASLLHCIAFGDQETAEARVEALLDSQCSGWRNAIVEDFTLPNLRLPTIPNSEHEDGVYHAHLGNAFSIGKRATQS
jgi:hypothetical protein